jgi:hypothetical protein
MQINEAADETKKPCILNKACGLRVRVRVVDVFDEVG